MTEGLIFYWFSWILWIIVTFLMKKNKRRTLLACYILIAIISSNTYISINSHSISVTIILLLFVTMVLLSRPPHFIYHVFISFTMMIGYAAMLIWKMNTPIWLLTHDFIMIPFISALVITLLVKGVRNKIVTGFLGITAGEFIYSILLIEYDLQKTIGEMSFFDMLIVTLMFIVLLDTLQKVKSKLFILPVHHKKIIKWQH
ncbi:YphA family membrane protein [Virgibacillus alimentarius]|uniref:Integral membrane protein n=1 Tax=Virgibacillus alimentarius TaxID=698769 RepID=A0ABS4S4H2_9BACI|nr:hypothetical protein [Virgibacillus alimentarius]MBP2256393.1 hypothetical protein [Virgibacillus alimentarius]